MNRLTAAQRDWLEWVGSTDGVTDITDRRIADPMVARGFARYFPARNVWRITPAGRAALAQEGGGDGE